MKYYPAIKKNDIIYLCNNLDELPKNYTDERNQSKTLHIASFHLYNILQMTKYRNGEQISGCQELMRGFE